MKLYSSHSRNQYHAHLHHGSFSTRLSSELSVKTNSLIQNSFTSVNAPKHMLTDTSKAVSSFHKHLLRDSIHHNTKYKYLFIEPYLTPIKSQNDPYSNPCNSTSSHQPHSNASSTKPIIKSIHFHNAKNPSISTNLYSSLSKTDNTVSPFFKQRAYTLNQFKGIVNNIRKEKYKLSIQKNQLKRHNCDTENHISLIEHNIHNYSYSARLLNSFTKEYDLYTRYLDKTKEKEIEKCEDLKQRRNRLVTEIQRLKRKQQTLKSMFVGNVKTKQFLMAMKNCTQDEARYSVEDKQEIVNDELRFQKVLNQKLMLFKKSQTLNDKHSTSSFGRGKHTPKIYPIKNNTLHSSSHNVNASDGDISCLHDKKNYTLFKSPEECNRLLTALMNKITLQMNTYNDIQNEILQLKLEKIDFMKEMKSKASLTIKHEILICTDKLSLLKQQHDTLNSIMNKLMTYNANSDKLRVKIEEMYYLYNNGDTMYQYTRHLIKLDLIKALSDIELFVMKLLQRNKELKLQMPKCYKKQKVIQDQANKIISFKLFKQSQHHKFIDKIRNIIQSSQKLYVLPHKKVDSKEYLFLNKLKRLKEVERKEMLMNKQKGLALSDYI